LGRFFVKNFIFAEQSYSKSWNLRLSCEAVRNLDLTFYLVVYRNDRTRVSQFKNSIHGMGGYSLTYPSPGFDFAAPRLPEAPVGKNSLSGFLLMLDDENLRGF